MEIDRLKDLAERDQIEVSKHVFGLLLFVSFPSLLAILQFARLPYFFRTKSVGSVMKTAK